MLPWQMNKIFFIAKFHFSKISFTGQSGIRLSITHFSPLCKTRKDCYNGRKRKGALEWSCKRGGLRTRLAEIRTYDLLDRLGVAYERVDHAPAMTMEVCQEIDQTLQAVICKNLFLCNRQETAFYLLMIPDTKVFHTKDLSAQIGAARLSFAKPEYMEKFLDITPGSVSVLGLMNDTGHRVQLLIDEDVLNSEFVGCHPCINTSSLRLRTKDLIEKILPAVEHDFIRVKL